ncbi:hypothetical protein Cgig2_026265 [Carnegiea gigantea]|uniref:Uncharacterized protein n=1 Tax=Carnegiea gigantea TaxID=171969 RepID=A0A9Q1JUM7_9CARY|nr:hypothetical protein Cgig2_026265 [Carnegiea gigantea]
MSLFRMEQNPDKGKQTQSYIPTIQDFVIKPKSQIQTQTHPTYPEIKIQNQYESLTEFPPIAYSQPIQTLKLQTSTPFLTQESPFLKADTLKNHRFYELILLDTKSTRMEHTKDDKGKVLYSKFQILKTLSSKEWGSFIVMILMSCLSTNLNSSYRKNLISISDVILIKFDDI